MNQSILSLSLLCFLVGCGGGGKSDAKSQQAVKAEAAANSIQFSENAEIENIKHRLELTADPGLLGFIVLFNEAGQPVLYSGVKGKVTSGGKRLTKTQHVSGTFEHPAVTDAPSDEGTYGHSGEYIFFWTPAGEYRQWNGKYLYSDKPIRLTVQPLVVSVQEAK